MNVSLIRALLVLTLSFAGAPLAAQTTAFETCDAGNAEPATIDAIKADRDRWRGRCVALEGLYGHLRLFADEAALAEYEVYGQPEDRWLAMQYYRPGDRERLLAALGWSEEEAEAGAIARVRLVGIVGYCTDEHAAIARRQRDSETIILLSAGLCHYTSEDKLNPVSLERLDP